MFSKKIFAPVPLLLFILLFSQPLYAHNLWIETNPTGQVGESQEVSIYLGEYAYGVRDNIEENQEMIGQILVWLIHPNGETSELESSIDGNRFLTEFTPEESGSYQIALTVNEAPVVDWRDYDLGILKTNFFSTATIQVGTTENSKLVSAPVSGKNQLVVTPVDAISFDRETPIEFEVTFNGKPLAEQEVVIGYQDKWFKSLYTDEAGKINLSLPWDDSFVIETVYTEETPGTFQGDEYEAIRHTATFRIPPARK